MWAQFNHLQVDAARTTGAPAILVYILEEHSSKRSLTFLRGCSLDVNFIWLSYTRTQSGSQVLLGLASTSDHYER